ncbi:omega-6 fatty acid desaturase [Raphidocelis subcapitata]|uniref:Omega-6 fatty acid desaturase n=1 Tax=Raphidocelis subcapitata TaxID=307507 RepID=A0A2V0PT22_9CHLO|nr:omega-6 fatty acid desaturase [Raphidocelis subcapitata]|eukprot:GBG00516.1 omega-6 fatty acid desaturase [Raphidocelis subcapitata]
MARCRPAAPAAALPSPPLPLLLRPPRPPHRCPAALPRPATNQQQRGLAPSQKHRQRRRPGAWPQRRPSPLHAAADAAEAEAAAAAAEPSASGAPAASTSAAAAAPGPGGAAAAGARQEGVRSFDLRLPDAATATAGLGDLDETQLEQQAQARLLCCSLRRLARCFGGGRLDWGFSRLGAPFPEGVSLHSLAETLSPAHFDVSPRKAFAGVALAAAAIAAGCWWQAYMHSICPAWQQVLCWLAIGTGYFGAFQSAVDCARFCFWPQRPLVQDVIGAALMAPALVPYEGWRLQQFNHLLRPNMLWQDSPLWHPLTAPDLAPLPAWRRALLRLANATPLRFLARGLAGWAASWDGLDLRRHPPAARPWVVLSWAVPAGFAALVLPALLAGGGLERLVGWWLAPWLVFNAWQGLVAVAERTAPHIPFVEEGYEYDHGQAVVNGTVNLGLPRWLEALVGGANLGLPRMMSISIPRYNLRPAYEELKAKLGPYLTEADLLSPRLLLNLSTRWLIWDPKRRGYVRFDDLEAGAESEAARAAAAEDGPGPAPQAAAA